MIIDKLMELPLGVVFGIIFMVATAFFGLMGILAFILGTHPSLLIVISMLVFTVIRLVYFAFTRK